MVSFRDALGITEYVEGEESSSICFFGAVRPSEGNYFINAGDVIM